MFFSTTDERGIITAASAVFMRVNGYAPEELIGSAHNIIRHPGMPRAVFRLVWDYLKPSRRVAAMVKNLARDGCYYWAVALFAPVPGGYVSIRFKSTSRLVDELEDVYAAMRAEEDRQLAQGQGKDAAMDASTALLVAAVRARGYADYDAFMRAMLCNELKSRDAVLAGGGCSIVRSLPDEKAGDAAACALTAHLRSLYRQGTVAYGQLSRLFLRLDEFVALQQALEGKANFVDNLTRELRVAAINSALAATRVGDEGQSLSVVSNYMGNASLDVAAAVKALTAGIGRVAVQLRSVIFNLAAGRLQIEMIMGLMHELLTMAPEGGKRASSAGAVKVLHQAFRHSLERASVALHSLEANTRELNPTSSSLGRHMLELQVTRLCGAVETTRVHQQGEFAAVFSHIRQLVDDTQGQLAELGDALTRLGAIAVETPATARAIAGCAAQMETEMAETTAVAA